MKILFSGKGSNVNMHLMGLSVKEAMEISKIYKGNKFIDNEKKEVFKDSLYKCKLEIEETSKEKTKGIEDNHNLERYLSWRGRVLNNIGRINQR